MLYWRGDIYYRPVDRQSCPRSETNAILAIYFLCRLGCGARCESALAAAIFAGFELRELFNTDEAAFAATELVLR
jgi:hypothetical protein